MSETYRLVLEPPSVEDYLRLRLVSGLSPKTVESATIGLPNSWFGVTVFSNDRAIGMGRIIGDGGNFFQICDIAVEPEHQGKGLGKRIMTALMERLNSRAPVGAYVSLIADGDAKHLYAQYGFAEVTPKSVGMALVIGKN